MILYEFPLHERIRTYLRLEQLFQRLGQLMARDTPLDHHYALVSLFEIMDVGSRADLKTDVLRDLEKHKQQLSSYRGNPQIDQDVLEQTIGTFENHFSALNAIAGKAGQALTENDWLMSIRSRCSIPGGTCSFDLPAYFAWQHRDAASRQADLRRWIESLTPLASAIAVLLQMLRDSGSPQKVLASGGSFQQTLPQGRTFQLMRLRIEESLGLVPEISANRLMVSVRLMRMDDTDHLVPAGMDASFEVTLCS